MNNSKKGILVNVILAIILVSILTVGIIQNRKLLSQNKVDYDNWLKEKNAEKNNEVNTEEEQPKNQEDHAQETEAKTAEENLNLYAKLKNKEAIKSWVRFF